MGASAFGSMYTFPDGILMATGADCSRYGRRHLPHSFVLEEGHWNNRISIRTFVGRFDPVANQMKTARKCSAKPVRGASAEQVGTAIPVMLTMDDRIGFTKGMKALRA